MAVLGHEMGHSVDPCGCQTHFHTIDKGKVEALWANGTLPLEIEKDKDLKLAAQKLGQIANFDAKVTALPFERFMENPDKLDHFVKLGLITPGPGKVKTVKQNGKSLDGYFLNDVYKCLMTTTDGSFRQTTPADIEDAADFVANQRQAVAGPSFDREREKKLIIQAFERFPQCHSPRSKTQMGEVISDWFGSKALGEFLENQKLTTPEDRLAPVAYFSNMICIDRMTVEKPETTIINIVDGVRSDLEKDAGEHPNRVTRLEKVMLADSRFRKAMGCSERIASTCDHSTGATATSATQTQTPEIHR